MRKFFHLLQHVGLLPSCQQPFLPIENQFLQVLVERLLVWNLCQDMLHIFGAAGLHILHLKTFQSTLSPEQNSLALQHQLLIHAPAISFSQLSNTPGPPKEVQIGVNSNYLFKPRIVLCQQCHHVIKFVHLTMDTLPIFVQRWILVEKLGRGARACWMWDLCDRIDISFRIFSTNPCMLIDCEGTDPVSLLKETSHQECFLHNLGTFHVRQKFSNKVKRVLSQSVSYYTSH
mmetsp:Transcript_53917/g.118086  ORF Transcript_53917/g.118086 Transcript_53917/m.118086 type:complete len:231 (+) Transcript_53917:82-774(+)